MEKKTLEFIEKTQNIGWKYNKIFYHKENNNQENTSKLLISGACNMKRGCCNFSKIGSNLLLHFIFESFKFGRIPLYANVS